MSLQEAVMLILKQFRVLERSLLNQPAFHREFIGELGSLIFFPVFIRNGEVVDGYWKVIGPEKDLDLTKPPGSLNIGKSNPYRHCALTVETHKEGGKHPPFLHELSGCMEPLIR
jgi:hypothetical protein